METVCVTGASGFVASLLVKRLLEKGYRVRGTVRDLGNEKKTAHLRALPGAAERLQLFRAELTEEGSFDEAIKGCTGVFHTATPVLFHETDDPERDYIIPAVQGTLNVLKATLKESSVKRVVFTSSIATIRSRKDLPDRLLDENDWSDEDHCRANKNWYALSKILAEKAAWDFAKKNNIDLVVVIPAFILGPCLPPDLTASMIHFEALLKGDLARMNNHTYSRLVIVHVEDVVKAHILVYEEPSANGRYICAAVNLTSAEAVTLWQQRYPGFTPQIEADQLTKPYYPGISNQKIVDLGLQFQSLETIFDDAVAELRRRGSVSF